MGTKEIKLQGTSQSWCSESGLDVGVCLLYYTRHYSSVVSTRLFTVQHRPTSMTPL